MVIIFGIPKLIGGGNSGGGNSGGGSGAIESLIVTENGTYTPPEGVDGYSPVSVMVAPPASDIDALLDGSITEITSGITGKLHQYSFFSCASLISANFPNAVSVGVSAFEKCTQLSLVNFQQAATVGSKAFCGCKNLQKVCFPAVVSVFGSAFDSCELLLYVDLPIVANIYEYAFYRCSVLKSLILRSETIATLTNTNAFNYSGVKSGTGYIYVPAALVEDYKAATNWSTYADRFRALEDYTVDGTITGELDETKI